MSSVAHDPAIGTDRQDANGDQPTLVASGLMVTREDLVRALRLYLPSLADLEVLDRERFLLKLAQSTRGN
jgi:hypothetical protein